MENGRNPADTDSFLGLVFYLPAPGGHAFEQEVWVGAK